MLLAPFFLAIYTVDSRFCRRFRSCMCACVSLLISRTWSLVLSHFYTLRAWQEYMCNASVCKQKEHTARKRKKRSGFRSSRTPTHTYAISSVRFQFTCFSFTWVLLTVNHTPHTHTYSASPKIVAEQHQHPPKQRQATRVWIYSTHICVFSVFTPYFPAV